MIRYLTPIFLTVIFSISTRADELQDGVDALCSGEYQTAASILRPLAEAGNPRAQTKLGLMYYRGYGVPTNFSETFNWIRRAALQGDTEAQRFLGIAYESGLGLPRNITEGIKLLILAAQGGDSAAQDSIASFFREQGKSNPDYLDESLHWYQSAAQNGDGGVQLTLGDMYYSGEYEGTAVQQDFEKAAQWYRLSAENGYADAAKKLGNMYLQGEGMQPDEISAHAWLSLAQEGIPDIPDENLYTLPRRFNSEELEQAKEIKEGIKAEITSRRDKSCRRVK